MDKLREAILKMANSEPNVPLSQTKNVILQQHLNRFFDCLHIAPDHPPYSWMIEKALQELNEKGDPQKTQYLHLSRKSMTVCHGLI